jgi:hypothetical protein
VPVGYVDCGTFDRCAVYGGESQDGPIILETIEAITGAIAFPIDPARRRERLATQMIRALIDHPDLSTVELFEAGVEPENQRVPAHAAGCRISPAFSTQSVGGSPASRSQCNTAGISTRSRCARPRRLDVRLVNPDAR